MKNIGFELQDKCPWRQVGTAKLEGTRPDEHRIRSQAHTGISLLGFAMETSWGGTASHKQSLTQLQEQLRQAQKICLD